MVAIRKDHIKHARAYSETLRTPFKPRNTELCQATIHILQTHPDGHGIWTDMWTDALRTALQSRVPRALPPQMVTKTITNRRRALLNLGIILAAGTIELWDTRRDTILALDPTYPTTPLTPPLHLPTPTTTPDNTQPLITQYIINHDLPTQPRRPHAHTTQWAQNLATLTPSHQYNLKKRKEKQLQHSTQHNVILPTTKIDLPATYTFQGTQNKITITLRPTIPDFHQLRLLPNIHSTYRWILQHPNPTLFLHHRQSNAHYQNIL
eukprot:gene42166-biopygen8085